MDMSSASEPAMCTYHIGECILDAGADWKQFNKGHSDFRKNTVRLYGNKRQLYKQHQLALAATAHAALPLFGLQASLHMLRLL